MFVTGSSNSPTKCEKAQAIEAQLRYYGHVVKMKEGEEVNMYHSVLHMDIMSALILMCVAN